LVRTCAIRDGAFSGRLDALEARDNPHPATDGRKIAPWPQSGVSRIIVNIQYPGSSSTRMVILSMTSPGGAVVATDRFGIVCEI
jgi:hypothetical protein